MKPEDILQDLVEQYAPHQNKVYSQNKGGLEEWYEEKVVIQAMKDFAMKMCDRQREICSNTVKPIMGEVDVEGCIFKEIVDIDYESILNSPYPEELQ